MLCDGSGDGKRIARGRHHRGERVVVGGMLGQRQLVDGGRHRGRVEAARIGVGRVRHAERVRRGVHLADERVDRARDVPGQHHRDVVRGRQEQRHQRLAFGEPLAGPHGHDRLIAAGPLRRCRRRPRHAPRTSARRRCRRAAGACSTTSAVITFARLAIGAGCSSGLAAGWRVTELVGALAGRRPAVGREVHRAGCRRRARGRRAPRRSRARAARRSRCRRRSTGAVADADVQASVGPGSSRSSCHGSRRCGSAAIGSVRLILMTPLCPEARRVERSCDQAGAAAP